MVNTGVAANPSMQKEPISALRKQVFLWFTVLNKKTMKVIIATSLFILLGFSCINTVLGQQIGHLSITDVHVQNIGDSIELSFYCTPYLSLRKERIIVTPILADSIHQLRFPSFVIIGTRGKKTFIRSSDYLRNIKLINTDQAL